MLSSADDFTETDSSSSIFLDKDGNISDSKIRRIADEVVRYSAKAPMASAVLGAELLLISWKMQQDALCDEYRQLADKCITNYLENRESNGAAKKAVSDVTDNINKYKADNRIPRIRVQSTDKFVDDTFARLYLWKTGDSEIVFLITHKDLQDKIDSVLQSKGKWTEEIISTKDKQRTKVAHELFHFIVGQYREAHQSPEVVRDTVEVGADIFAQILVELRAQETEDIATARKEYKASEEKKGE